MAIITVPGPLSGKGYRIQIAGDSPTMDEQLKIDQFVRQQEGAFKSEYEQFYGQPMNYENGWEISEQTGEFFKGAAAGSVGIFESGLLGLAAALPEWAEAPTREVIRSGAYAIKPQEDIGREGNLAGSIGSGLGSMAGLAGVSFLNPAAGVGLSMASGAGESSERARAAGATEEERAVAAALGLIPGAFDYLPVSRMINRLGLENVKGFKASLGRILQQGGEEAAQEAAQELAQNLIAQGIYDPEQDLIDGVGGAAGMGGAVGALAQSLFELVLPGKSHSVTPPAPKVPADGKVPPTGGEPPAASPPPVAETEAAAADEEFDDDNLIPLPFANLAAPVRPGTPEFDNLTEVRKAQEGAYAKAMELGGGLVPSIMKLAAEGKGAPYVAKELGRTLNSLTAGEKDAAARAKVRNGFIENIFTRIGIPLDETSTEFQKWKAQYTAFAGTPKKSAPMVDLPPDVADAAKQKKDKAAKNAPSPKVASEIEELAGTNPTEATQPTSPEDGAVPEPVRRDAKLPKPKTLEPATPTTPATPATATSSSQSQSSTETPVVEKSAVSSPVFTKDFVIGTLGFSKGSTVSKAAENDPALSGKPLTDPAVRAKLEGLLANAIVTKERKDAIRAALASASTLEAAPESDLRGEASAEVPNSTEEDVASKSEQMGAEGVLDPSAVPRGPYEPMSGATPGQTGGLPGQPVPAPSAVPRKRLADAVAEASGEGITLPRVKMPPREKKRRLAVPTDEANIREQERILAADARARDSVNNRELGDQLADTVRKKLSPEDIEFLGLNELPDLRPDVTDAGDKRSILRLLGRGGANTAEERAAKVFFSKFPNPTEALEEIGAQSVVGPGQVQAKSENADPAVGFYIGMGRNSAKKARRWVYETLSKDARRALARARADAGRTSQKIYVRGLKGKDPVELARKAEEAQAAQMDEIVYEDPRLATAASRNKLLMDAATQKAENKEVIRRAMALGRIEAPTTLPDKFAVAGKREDITKLRGQTKFDRWMNENYSKEEQSALSDAELLQLFEDYAYSVAQGYALTKDAATALDVPLLPSIRRLIIAGRTKGVFDAIAANAESSGVARVARALANKMGSTKIEMVLGLTNGDGDPVSGLFDPKTNTMYIDSIDGMNVHTILHEGTHAVVSETIDRPGHPLTQQLRALYNKVKPALGAMYGTSNLQEFAAELLSNPAFQARLAQLTVRGKKISALDVAMHALRNFVRRLIGLSHVSMETALTRGDQIIMGMMAPAPESRNAGVMYSAQAKGVAGKIVTNMINNAPLATPERINAITDVVSDTSGGLMALMREGLLRLTPLHYLSRVAEPYFPGMATRLNDLVNASSGELSRVRDTMQALSASVGKWATANGDKVDTLNSLINNSTLHQVDPELTVEEAMSKFGSDTERMDQWRMAKAEWNAVGPEGQAQYRTMRNTFKALREELLRVMDLRLQASVENEEVRRKLRNDLHEKILGKKDRTIEPYFPLGRRGDYWLSYNAIDHRTGNFEFFVEAFESPSERRRFMEEIKADATRGAGNFREMPRKDAVDFTQAPPLSFMGALHKNLTKQGVDPKVIKTIAQVYLDTVPETSYLHAFRERKGTLGFNKDGIRTAVERASGLARTITQLKYGNQLAALKSEINEHAGRLAANNQYGPGVQQLREQLDAFADFAASPNRPRAAQLVTTATFNMTLGFNVSTALLNLMQTPMILLPTLGGRYGWLQSTKAIGAAARSMAGAPHTREIEVYGPDGTTKTKERVKAAPSLENYDFDDPNLPEDIRQLRYLVEIGRDNGQFNRSIAYDILDMENRLPSESKVSVALDKAQAASGWMLHQTERINRETAMAAAYRLELDRIQKKEGRPVTEAEMRDAAKQAIYITEMTNGGTAAAATPRIAHSGIGQIAFMYKRYGVSMYALLFDTAKRSLKNADPADRREAIKQIAGIAGMTGLLSGVAGLPMFGAISMLYNLLLADDEDQEFGIMVREAVGDGPYRGVINGLLGVNVASRIELSNLLFRESLIEKDQSSLWTLLESVGGPAIGTYLNIERGIKKLAEGEAYDGITAGAPAPMRYILRALEYANEGVLTRGGDKIVDDLHPGHILAQALGFSPAELTMQQEINSARKKFEKAVVDRRGKLTERYAMAVQENNREALNDVLQEIAQFNRDHPYWPVTRDTLKRSMSSREKTNERTFNGVSYNPKLMAPALAFASDYGQ